MSLVTSLQNPLSERSKLTEQRDPSRCQAFFVADRCSVLTRHLRSSKFQITFLFHDQEAVGKYVVKLLLLFAPQTLNTRNKRKIRCRHRAVHRSRKFAVISNTIILTKKKSLKKQSRYRPGQALRSPGG